MTREENVKPCPKCKSTYVKVTYWGTYTVCCCDCLYKVGAFFNETDAINAWNKESKTADKEEKNVT